MLEETGLPYEPHRVSFDTGDLQHDQIHGNLTAANLRALLSDPDFVNAISTVGGFRLSPKR